MATETRSLFADGLLKSALEVPKQKPTQTPVLSNFLQKLKQRDKQLAPKISDIRKKEMLDRKILRKLNAAFQTPVVKTEPKGETTEKKAENAAPATIELEEEDDLIILPPEKKAEENGPESEDERNIYENEGADDESEEADSEAVDEDEEEGVDEEGEEDEEDEEENLEANTDKVPQESDTKLPEAPIQLPLETQDMNQHQASIAEPAMATFPTLHLQLDSQSQGEHPPATQALDLHLSQTQMDDAPDKPIPSESNSQEEPEKAEPKQKEKIPEITQDDIEKELGIENNEKDTPVAVVAAPALRKRGFVEEEAEVSQESQVSSDESDKEDAPVDDEKAMKEMGIVHHIGSDEEEGDAGTFRELFDKDDKSATKYYKDLIHGGWRRKYKDSSTLDSDDEWETSMQSQSVALSRQNRIFAREQLDFDLQGIFQATSDPSVENDEEEKKYQEQVSKKVLRMEMESSLMNSNTGSIIFEECSQDLLNRIDSDASNSGVSLMPQTTMKRNFASFLNHNATKLKKMAEKQQTNLGKSGGHFVLKENSSHASNSVDLNTSSSNAKPTDDSSAKKLKVDSKPDAAPQPTKRLFDFLSKNRFTPAQA